MNEQKNIRITELEVNNGQIKGLPKNPRFIRDERFKALKKSIEDAPEMLALRELLVYPHNGKYVVIGGNMRLRACKEIGYKEIPCKVLNEDTPVEKLREYAIKDNVGFGSDDWDIIANEWDTEELQEWGMELPDDWTGSDEETEETEIVEDEIPEDVETRCKRGDVWKLGEHRLMCGDSTKAEDVEKLMNGEKADMVFTDPPYGVSYADKNEFLNSLGAGHRLTKRIENDNKTSAELFEFWEKAFANLFDSTKEKMAFYITTADSDLLLLLLQALHEVGFMPKHELIWNKNNHVLGRCDYNYKHEPIIYGWKEGKTHNFYGESGFTTTVWDISKPLNSDLHPTMKPIELIAVCLKDTTRKGDSALDLFGGSGSTLIACEQLNRKCFMMELDEHYCDVIIARWEKLTGKTANKI